MGKRSRNNIYDYFQFEGYTAEEIDQAISLLNEHEKNRTYFNKTVFLKLKNELQKLRNRQENNIEKINRKENEPAVLKENETIQDDQKKCIELLEHPFFKEMMKHLPIQDCLILALSVGFKGKKFETEAIASFLGKENEEIEESVKRGLDFLKEETNRKFDQIKQKIKK